MDGASGSARLFTCPECGETLEVNEAMEVALVERGCVICGASVTAAAFSDPPAEDGD